MFISASTPFSRIASRIDARLIGKPALLPGEAHHEHVGGDRVADERVGQPLRLDEMRAARPGALLDRAGCSRRVGSEKSAARVKSPGIGLVQIDEDAALARADRRQRLLASPPPRCRRRAPCRPPRPRCGWNGSPPASGAIRMWIETAPPFCASPAMSMMPTPSPSRCAAMPSTAPTVTTPVPPTPVIRMPLRALRASRSRGSGIGGSASRRDRACPPSAARRAPSRRRGRNPRGRNSPCCSSTGRSSACGRTPSPAAESRRSWI